MYYMHHHQRPRIQVVWSAHSIYVQLKSKIHMAWNHAFSIIRWRTETNKCDSTILGEQLCLGSKATNMRTETHTTTDTTAYIYTLLGVVNCEGEIVIRTNERTSGDHMGKEGRWRDKMYLKSTFNSHLRNQRVSMRICTKVHGERSPSFVCMDFLYHLRWCVGWGC